MNTLSSISENPPALLEKQVVEKEVLPPDASGQHGRRGSEIEEPPPTPPCQFRFTFSGMSPATALRYALSSAKTFPTKRINRGDRVSVRA